MLASRGFLTHVEWPASEWQNLERRGGGVVAPSQLVRLLEVAGGTKIPQFHLQRMIARPSWRFIRSKITQLLMESEGLQFSIWRVCSHLDH